MFVKMFPRAHARYESLPLLGPQVEEFVSWLFSQEYPDLPIRRRVQQLPRLDVRLRRRGVRRLVDISAAQLLACRPPGARCSVYGSALVISLTEFLVQRGLLRPPALTPREQLVAAYYIYLRRVRSFADSTLKNHCNTVDDLLRHLRFDDDPRALWDIGSAQIESFIRAISTGLTRASLQHSVAHLRSFLRFLASRSEIRPGLDMSIDSPRVYRGEQLPRALPWATVRAFLAAIDRSTPIGRRDYAMFMLIATYGLRVSEVAALRLDDIDWRAERISIPRRKVSTPLVLPLTTEVGDALLDYVRHDRPKASHRQVFLRVRAPIGPIVPTAVSEAFQSWKRHSHLSIGDGGPHRLRHSLAVHLLRTGASIKIIGDLLGHRSAESTCVYLRLHVADLRDAALELPAEARS